MSNIIVFGFYIPDQARFVRLKTMFMAIERSHRISELAQNLGCHFIFTLPNKVKLFHIILLDKVKQVYFTRKVESKSEFQFIDEFICFLLTLDSDLTQITVFEIVFFFRTHKEQI